MQEQPKENPKKYSVIHGDLVPVGRIVEDFLRGLDMINKACQPDEEQEERRLDS